MNKIYKYYNNKLSPHGHGHQRRQRQARQHRARHPAANAVRQLQRRIKKFNENYSTASRRPPPPLTLPLRYQIR